MLLWITEECYNINNFKTQTFVHFSALLLKSAFYLKFNLNKSPLLKSSLHYILFMQKTTLGNKTIQYNHFCTIDERKFV